MSSDLKVTRPSIEPKHRGETFVLLRNCPLQQLANAGITVPETCHQTKPLCLLSEGKRATNCSFDGLSVSEFRSVLCLCSSGCSFAATWMISERVVWWITAMSPHFFL